MAKARTLATKTKRVAKPAEALGPGVHAAKIELESSGTLRVRTVAGQRLTAVLGDDVELAFAEECFRTGRTVFICDTERGPTVMGALQTSRGLVREGDGLTTLAATDLRIRADRSITLESGSVSLRLEKTGLVRAEGERLILDMASVIRLLSAQVELP